MAFISKSVTDATKVSTSVADLSKIQSGFTGNISEISKASSTAISANVIAPITSATTTANTAASSVGGIIGQVNSGIAGVNSYLQSSLKSISSTFENSVKGLASGLDSTLSGLFKDTNVKTASATTTVVSDPIKTNLLTSKLPSSSAFKINGFEAGSQTAGMSGSSSQFGSNASSMISTNLSTVMNRLNLDSANSVASGITSSKANSSLKGLFSTVSSVTQTIGGVAGTVKAIAQLPNTLSAQVAKSIENNLQSFLGRSTSLTSLTGVNASDYYLGSSNLTLVDNTGTVTTSSTDASTANAILAVARLIGCDTNDVNEYSSVDELSSLFNMILSLASEQGLTSLVESLLGCSTSSTTAGQASVLNALTSVSGTNIALTNTLINNITDSSVLYKNKQLAQSIIANNGLTGNDASAVTTALASLSYTPTGIYEIGLGSSGSLTVYNDTILSSSQKSILDSLFDDTTLSTYLTGQTVTLQANGTYLI